METNTANEFNQYLWEEEIHNWMIIRLNSYTKDSTRTQGRRLIWLSFLLVLLTYGVLDIKEISIGGVSGIAASKSIIIATIVVCFYMLLTYAIDLFVDLNSWPYNKLQQIREDLVGRTLNVFKEKKSLLDRHNELSILREKKKEDLIKKYDPNQEYYRQMTSIPDTQGDDSIEYWNRLEKILTVERIINDEYDNYCKKDGQKEIETMLTKFNNEEAIQQVFRTMNNKLTKIYYANKFRLITEVLFPICCSIFAIISGIVKN